MLIEEKNIPVGIQDFEKLRTGNYIYVDKTEYVYMLGKTDRPYFLSRPRRFGKSLLLSTVKAYFEGKKELFDDLAIADLENEWTKYPVFYIDLNSGMYSDLSSTTHSLNVSLRHIEAEWGSAPIEDSPADRLEWLIRKAYSETGLKVAVLIDEYDKPLVSTMDDVDLNSDMRRVLNSFYSVLKSMDSHLRFLMLTGVTKFSKVNVFSDMNQLKDISMEKRYAGICGISDDELIKYFEHNIKSLARVKEKTLEETLHELKKRYNGYMFSKNSKRMYNPFSIVNTFDSLDFDNYWYQTGTPKFLVNMLHKIDFDIRTFSDGEITVTSETMTDYMIGTTNPIPLLYQSGYLTIKRYDESIDAYVLDFPNEEVKYGFIRNLLHAYVIDDEFILNEFFSGKFVKDILSGNTENFMRRTQALFASIPYDMLKKEDKDEKYYQFVFYLLYVLMGQHVQTEVKSASGRADAVIKTSDTIFVFEFKLSGNGTAEDALRQINEKSYSIPYIADGRKIVKIGAEFSPEGHELTRWLIEE